MSTISELFDAEKAKLGKTSETKPVDETAETTSTENSGEIPEKTKEELKTEKAVETEKEFEQAAESETVTESEPKQEEKEKLSEEEELDAIFSNDEDEIEDEILAKNDDENAKERTKTKWQIRRENIAKIEEQLARENNNVEITERLIEQGVQSIIYNKQIIKARIDGIEKSRHGYFANCTLRTRLGTIPVKIADSNLIENIEEKALANFNRIVNKNERSDVNAAQKEKLIQRWKIKRLNELIGAYIEFIAVGYVDGSVIGDRIAAMQERRKAFVPTRYKRLPEMRVGSRGVARIIRNKSTFIEVEFSGYEVRMTPYQISLLAINMNEYTVGKRFEAIVSDISDDFSKISLIGAAGHSSSCEQLYNQYRVGTIVIAEVVGYRELQKKKFAFILRLPNGCRGYAYDDINTLRRRPRVGDEIKVKIKNVTESRVFRAIKCELTPFATVSNSRRRNGLF